MSGKGSTVPKISYTASLIKNDEYTPTIRRAEIDEFYVLLDETVAHCTTSNIEKTTAWLLRTTVKVARRALAFMKLLNALARDFDNGTEQLSSNQSVRQRRLNLLYILHDVLHNLKFHPKYSAELAYFVASIETQIVPLVTLAADFDRSKSSKHAKKLDTVLLLWNGYVEKTGNRAPIFSDAIMSELLEVAKTITRLPMKPDVPEDKKRAYLASLAADKARRNGHKPVTEDLATHKPRSTTHGDPAQPWHTLPAGNFLAHFAHWKPDQPIKRQFVSAVDITTDGIETAKIIRAVDTFLDQVDLLSAPLTELMLNEKADCASEIGDPVKIIRNKGSVESKPIRTYYGWSSDFCEKMRRWQRNGPDATPDFVAKWRAAPPPQVERPVSPRPYPKSDGVLRRAARQEKRLAIRAQQLRSRYGRGLRTPRYKRGSQGSRQSSRRLFRITSRHRRMIYGQTGYCKGKRRPPPLGSLTRKAEKRAYLLTDNGRPGAKPHPLFTDEQRQNTVGNGIEDTAMQD